MVEDKNGVPLNIGARVKYYLQPHKATATMKTRMGTVLTSCQIGEFVDVVLDGDPFGSYVLADRTVFANAYDIEHPLVIARQADRRTTGTTRSNEGMTTKTKPSPKELRREAKALGIDYEDMDVATLAKAIKKARNGSGDVKVKKSKTTKDNEATKKAMKGQKEAKQAKKAAPTEVAENGNPYRPGTNLYEITEELLSGGKRSSMVKRLGKKIEVKPRDGRDIDEVAELDRRVLITAQILERDHGFTKEKEGRGPDATIQVFPPKKSKK